MGDLQKARNLNRFKLVNNKFKRRNNRKKVLHSTPLDCLFIVLLVKLLYESSFILNKLLKKIVQNM